MPSARNILLLGTEATIHSEVYQTYIKDNMPDTHLMTVACPLFAPMVEDGITDGAMAKR
jgi:glutamate racemase